MIWDGKLGSLRRFKDNVQEVEEGQECGIVLEGYADVKEEDVLEFYKTNRSSRRWTIGWPRLACAASTRCFAR